jgi:hypothetical protein
MVTSKRCVFLDADLDQCLPTILKFMEAGLDEHSKKALPLLKMRLQVDTYPRDKSRYEYIIGDRLEIEDELYNTLLTDQHIAIACTRQDYSLKIAENVKNIRGYQINQPLSAKSISIPFAYVHGQFGEGSAKSGLGKKILEEPNVYLRGSNVFLYTPVCVNSISIELDHFDVIFCFVDVMTLHWRDVMQMISRVRVPEGKTIKVYMSLPKAEMYALCDPNLIMEYLKNRYSLLFFSILISFRSEKRNIWI